jgi:uncharacterized protein with HEPN domain
MRTMPSSTLAALQQIELHIRLAEEFVADLDSATFQHDLRALYAVVRCLEIISEASRRIPDELKARHSSIPWREIAGAGNIYRHDYENVAANMIWETVRQALPPLRAVIVAEIEQAAESPDDGA